MAEKSSSVTEIPESDVSSDINSEIEREELKKHQRSLNIERSVTREREAFEKKFVSDRAKKIKDLQSLADQYSQYLFKDAGKSAEARAATPDVRMRDNIVDNQAHNKATGAVHPKSFAQVVARPREKTFDLIFGVQKPVLGAKVDKRKRPRTVECHTTERDILQSEVLAKLTKKGLHPQCIQKLGTNDFNITFATLEETRLFSEDTELINYDWGDDLPVHHPIYRRKTTFVSIFRAPVEMKLLVINRICTTYGRVIESRRQKIAGTDTYNGIITVIMELERPIPNFITIGAYNLFVLHNNQPATCRKCDSQDHKAAECNVKKCFNCGDPGHIRNECNKAPKCPACLQTGHSLRRCPDDDTWEKEEEYSDSEAEPEIDPGPPQQASNTTLNLITEQQEDELKTQGAVKTTSSQGSEIFPETASEETYLTPSEPSLVIDTDWSSLTDTDQPGADYDADNDERGAQGMTKKKQAKKRERRSESDDTIKGTRKEKRSERRKKSKKHSQNDKAVEENGKDQLDLR